MRTTRARAILSFLTTTALLALMLPASALAAPVTVTIGGSTAELWVSSGTSAGYAVGLAAMPANEATHTYAGSGADAIFDAPDRDTIGPSGGPFGLGVDNTLIANGNPGVTSKPSEIGYYGNTGICGADKVLGANCADQLAVTLDKPLYGGSFRATFLYGPEQSGEALRVILLRGGTEVSNEIYGPVSNGSYPGTAGIADFTLPATYWDQIRFVGYDAVVADASDFLVEFVSGSVRPEVGDGSATGVGAKIMTKGSWFMQNTYPDGDDCWDIQVNNPGIVIGSFCIAANGDGTFTATYDLADTVTFGDWAYTPVVQAEHLAISNSKFTSANAGLLDNQDFGVAFPDADAAFYVFAHWSIAFE